MGPVVSNVSQEQWRRSQAVRLVVVMLTTWTANGNWINKAIVVEAWQPATPPLTLATSVSNPNYKNRHKRTVDSRHSRRGRDSHRRPVLPAAVVAIPDDSNLNDAFRRRGGGDDTASSENTEETTSVSSATFAIVKTMLGSGVLALPSGVAAMSDMPGQILLPSMVLITVLGLLSAYTFHLLGRLTHVVKATSRSRVSSLGDLWQQIYQNDSKAASSSSIVSWASFLMCFGCLLVYSLIIGDSISNLANAVPWSAGTGPLGGRLLHWIRVALTNRQCVILGITGTVLYPLCTRLQSLSALAPLSILGTFGSILIIAFQTLRCPAINPMSPYATLAQVASSAQKQASFVPQLPTQYQPVFNTYNKLIRSNGARSSFKLHPSPLILVAMSSIAHMAHFSATTVYQSLSPSNPGKPPSDRANPSSTLRTRSASDSDGSTLQKYTKLTVWGYGIVMFFNAIGMMTGFLTFGGASAGNILNNYAQGDVGAVVARALVVISLTGSYPILFAATKTSALDLLQSLSKTFAKAANSPTTVALVSNGLLIAITSLALLVDDAGFVVSLIGAIMGTALVYLFPTMLFLRETKTLESSRFLKLGMQKETLAGQDGARRSIISSLRTERIFCKVLLTFGILSGVAGAVTSVLMSFFPYLLLS
jgi:amino acid permease